MIIREAAAAADHECIWQIFHAVISAGDAYVFDPATPREEALAYWFAAGTRTWVAAAEDGAVLGSYILRPNQPGRGSHIANASFMVSPAARGHGIGRAMGEHCIAEAQRQGFRALQFNIVVSTNRAAVHLWQQLGFQIIGTIPGAFRHSQLGFVDAHIMFLQLADDSQPSPRC